MFQCYSCSKAEVPEEFARCKDCDMAHKRLCEQLDSRPKNTEKKIKEELFPIKEIKQDVQVTTWMSREDLINNGMKVPV